MKPFHGLDTTSLPMLEFIKRNPGVSTRDISKATGMAQPTVVKVVNRLHIRKLVYVSGYCSLKRRRAKQYTAGRGKDLPYPYVTEEVSKERERLRMQSYYRRKRQREATQQGPFAAMVAQMNWTKEGK